MTTLSEALDVYIKQAFEKYSPLLIQLFYFILFYLWNSNTPLGRTFISTFRIKYNSIYSI